MVVNPRIRIGRRVSIERGARLRITGNGRLLIEDGCSIERNVTITSHGNIEIGRNCFIGEGASIAAKQSIQIGEDCLIASGVMIRDMAHGTQRRGVPFREQLAISKPVVIRDNVWLGAKASVLLGVKIGANSIIGAHGLVNRSIPEDSMAVGVPARVVHTVIQRDSLPT